MRGFFVLCCFLLISLGAGSGVFSAMAQSSISFTTNKNVGEKIKIRLYVPKDTPITIEGVEEEFAPTTQEYTLKQQQVTITGEVNKFHCSNNGITSIDTKNAAELKEILCSYNAIEHLDLSANKELSAVICTHSGLKSLNVAGADKLTYIGCENNNLTELNLKSNLELNHLAVSNNSLRSLDIAANTKLKNLFCENNELSALNVRGLEALIYVNCFGNKIKGQAMTDLMNGLPERSVYDEAEIRIINSKGQRHDNHCMEADVLIAEGKAWTVQDYNGGDKVFYYGSKEQPVEEVEEITLVTDHEESEDFQIRIEGEGDILLEGLEGTYKKGWNTYRVANKTIKIKGKVTLLNCSVLMLTAIDVSKAPSLRDLDCSSNRLTALDVSKNTELTDLEIFHNKITEIDLSNNKNLTYLGVAANKLTSLNLANNPKLTLMACFFNAIKGEEMTKFINSLPTMPGEEMGRLYIVNSVPSAPPANLVEENVCKAEDVAAAATKKWKLFDQNGGVPTEYLGANPGVGKGVISFQTQLGKGDKIALDLDSEENVAVQIEGVEEEYVPGAGLRDYTLTGSEVTVRGDITFFSCVGNKVKTMKVENPALRLLHAYNNLMEKIEIAPNPALKRVLLSANKLTSFSIANCPELVSISLYENNLTDITLSECPKLTYLDCFTNRIGEAAMKQLIAQLPTLPKSVKGIFLVVDTKTQVKEENVCPSVLVTAANDKNWEVRDYQLGSQGENGVLFYGTDLACEEVAAPNVECYPNPTTDRLFVEGTNPNDRVIIYALDGTILFQTKAQSSLVRVDMSQFPNGAYLVQVEGHTQKVVKK